MTKLPLTVVNFIQSTSDMFGPVALQDPTPSAARDFGAMVFEAPVAVMRPGFPADIARLLGALSSSPSSAVGPRAAVAARGAGHSLHGQTQARGGIVVRHGDGDVGGDALWVEVLEECLRAGGLAPQSWTDYLYLTVVGTLSNGGISGQAFKHGPQATNTKLSPGVSGLPRTHAVDGVERLLHRLPYPGQLLGGVGEGVELLGHGVKLAG